jgi:hypothetical protein
VKHYGVSIYSIKFTLRNAAQQQEMVWEIIKLCIMFIA